ncbi:DinB family protein [Lewinella sp. 4G2]|uniref:DinB family protein n=1 Tax=Lewinella sp. 4G2 TaxID=1803372 RepID=UPI0007B4BA13|nr:DinB family protein [Lewinella sp. 4G2]OAV43223.1 hypothetical protein A3850_001355 [Lewinella sp. 4G2]
MTQFDILLATRKNLIKICKDLTDEQLNRIPPGFNNNIIWNLGHVIATMEGLTYGLSGLPSPSGKEFIQRYRKGTKPEVSVGKEEIEEIFSSLITSVRRLREDWDGLDFSNFREYPTSYGITLRDVEDALTFNSVHEAMHLGTVIALNKLV